MKLKTNLKAKKTWEITKGFIACSYAEYKDGTHISKSCKNNIIRLSVNEKPYYMTIDEYKKISSKLKEELSRSNNVTCYDGYWTS